MNEKDIIVHLEKILFDREFYKDCVKESIKAFNSEFTIDVLGESFRKLIDQAHKNDVAQDNECI
jgi:hypothetical protein